MIKIGSHVSLKAPEMFLGSVKEALSYNANSMMVYTGAPQNTFRKSIDQMRINEAHEFMKNKGFELSNVVVHAPYIINLANPDPEKRSFATAFLTKEIIRTHSLGVTQMVLHPGSAVGKDRPQAIKWISEGLDIVFDNTRNLKVKIALETMAGKGNEVGKTFEELREIINLSKNKDRLSICLDTCHIFDAGYDIVSNYENVKNEFDKIIGLDKISVIHVNDSKNILGSSKDRHENLGFGNIGFETLLKVIYDKDFKDIVKILETPYINSNPPYFHEIEAIKLKKFNKELKNILNK